MTVTQAVKRFYIKSFLASLSEWTRCGRSFRALFLLFGWIENVYPSGSKPFNHAFMIVLYGSVTLAGMFVFGKHTWLKKADPFSVLFSLFARFSS